MGIAWASVTQVATIGCREMLVSASLRQHLHLVAHLRSPRQPLMDIYIMFYLTV